MTSHKKKALTDAIIRSDREAYKRVQRWHPGGRLPYHRFFEQARKEVRQLGHLLTRFKRGKDVDGKPDQWLYWAECKFCNGLVIVAHDEGWKITTRPKLKMKCEG